ncbi:MucR family transcriptional regulator [Azospirillum aestuarii]|uniref:MucR family transcriptional regulator n=1 Tax=Azospirillum aestuarii TaxID=2802052 RepID=UPI0031F2F816
MNTAAASDNAGLQALTAQVVAAYVGNHNVAPDKIPNLVSITYGALATAGCKAPEPVELVPAVPVKKSVTPDYIVCLEDGKKLKMLKRYLRSAFGMTPEEYRAKWGLPADYPMTAPNYAAKRSEFAKSIGLGKRN